MGELKRVLGYKAILLMTINSIIGSGLFILPALGAKISGTASLISWGILSIFSIYISMNFAELVGMFPSNGGVYEFSKIAYGRFPSFIVGWVSWLIGNITTAMLIVGAMKYLIPMQGVINVFGFPLSTEALRTILSILWVLIFNYMTFRGVKTSSVMLITFAIITLGIIGIILIPAIFHMDFSNLIPFFPHESISGNLSAIFVTIFLISETFFGIESICFLAGETKNPEKVLPKALINATIIITILTVLLIFVTFTVVPASIFANFSAPFADLVKITLGDIGTKIISLGTYLVILGAAAGWIVTGPRLIQALAKDKLFPNALSDIHIKYKTPYKAILFQTIATVIFILISSGSDGYTILVKLLTPMVLVIMTLVILIVPLLRKTQPSLNRPYKVKFPFIGPILVVLFYLFLIIMWVSEEQGGALFYIKLGISLVALGIPVYFLLMLYYNPDALRKILDKTAKFKLYTENWNS